MYTFETGRIFSTPAFYPYPFSISKTSISFRKCIKLEINLQNTVLGSIGRERVLRNQNEKED